MSATQVLPEEAEDLAYLMQGTQLFQIEGSGMRKEIRAWLSKCFSRFFIVDADDFDSTEEVIEIMDVREIRSGPHTDDLYEARNFLAEEFPTFDQQCFSVHRAEDQDILNLMAASPSDAARWSKVLSTLVERCQIAIRQNRTDPKFWLRREFNDKTNSGFLTFEQAKELLIKLNIIFDEDRAVTYFEAANTNSVRHQGLQVLDEEEFFTFYRFVSQRPALDDLFKLLADDQDKNIISTGKLLDFLKGQGVKNLNVEKVKMIIEAHEPRPSDPKDQPVEGMTNDGFRAMMISELTDIRKEEHRVINQPMDRPLSHYWIKSSHNTYLLADQLIGKSSIEGFRRAIARNYGCIELDLWDGPDGEPIIYHGHTLVTRILAKHVLEDGIRPIAFTHDDYPLILSIEDHLSDEQRKVFIQDLMRIMGDFVFIVNTDGMKTLPPLNSLKRKIIIKANSSKWGELANICQSAKFPNDALVDTFEGSPVYHVSSLSEHKVNQLLNPTLVERLLCIDEGAECRIDQMREYTKSHLLRAYPGGHRQLSGNYDPFPGMNAGIQIAALNIQTKCTNMALYEGIFRANGDCAYALKPDFLIDPSAKRMGLKRVKIKIISGQNLPKSNQQNSLVSNPYVEVHIVGDPVDKMRKKTKRVDGNGLNPVWNTEWIFDIDVPELAVILFKVKHFECLRSYTLGSFALPVLSLAEGYRHVPLQDSEMVRLPLSTLFVHVSVRDYKVRYK